MTANEIIALLEDNKNERGIKVWQGANLSVKTFGLGVTAIKKLTKGIKKDNDLAIKLLDSDIFDAKIAAITLFDPKKLTREIIEEKVLMIDHWMLSTQFASVVMPKVSFLKEIAVDWCKEDDTTKRICGYLFLSEYAKKNKQESDDFFLPYIEIIKDNLQSEENFVKDAMNNALLSIGSKSRPLNEKALEAAKKIGRVEVDYGDNSCQALNVEVHLSSERMQKIN